MLNKDLNTVVTKSLPPRKNLFANQRQNNIKERFARNQGRSLQSSADYIESVNLNKS